MIKIDPIGLEGFSMNQVSDMENSFNCVVAISDKKSDVMPLVELKFEEFNSQNQQVDLTTKYAKANEKKFLYADIKHPCGTITVNVEKDKSQVSLINWLSKFINEQYKNDIALYVGNNISEDFYYHLKSVCPQVLDVDLDAYSKATAKGAFYSLRALQQFLNSSKSIQHKHIVVRGLDKVGSEVSKLVDKNQANLTVCDSDKEKINDLYASAYFGTCDMEESHKVPSDVYILCDRPDHLDRTVTQDLKALAVIGISDCQLTSNKAGYNMHTKKIVYVPDYVAGVGGLVMIAKQLEGNKKSLEKELDKIFTRTLFLLNYSLKLGKHPFIVAEQHIQNKTKTKVAEKSQ